MKLPWSRETPALISLAELINKRGGVCTYCGGIHSAPNQACPRVKRFRYSDVSPDAQIVIEVEFFDHWDTSRVIWPEDLPQDESKT